MSEKYIGNFGARLSIKDEESDEQQVTICFANGYGVNLDEFPQSVAIALCRRILMHFGVLPTASELFEITVLLEFAKLYKEPGWRDECVPEAEEGIAKLRRLVGEEGPCQK